MCLRLPPENVIIPWSACHIHLLPCWSIGSFDFWQTQRLSLLWKPVWQRLMILQSSLSSAAAHCSSHKSYSSESVCVSCWLTNLRPVFMSRDTFWPIGCQYFYQEIIFSAHNWVPVSVCCAGVVTHRQVPGSRHQPRSQSELSIMRADQWEPRAVLPTPRGKLTIQWWCWVLASDIPTMPGLISDLMRL